jgi:hypothetical protein
MQRIRKALEDKVGVDVKVEGRVMGRKELGNPPFYSTTSE